MIVVGVLPYSESGGGPSARARNLGLALHRAGVRTEMMFTGPQSRRVEWQQIPITIVSSPPKSSNGRRPLLARLRKQRVDQAAVDLMLADLAARSPAPDVLLFYNQDVAYALQAARVCRRKRIAFVQQYAELHLPTDYPTGRRSTYWLSEQLHLRIMPRIADGAVVISDYLMDAVGRRAAYEPVLIPTVAEVPTQAQRTLRQPPTSLCVSKGARRDDLEVLVRAMSLLNARGGNTRLQIVGLADEARSSLRALVEQLGLGSNVELVQHLSEPAFRAAVAAADSHVLLRTADRSSIACFPSRLYEMFSFAAPVLLSAVGDIPRYFVDQRDVLLVPPSDQHAIAEKLLWLERNPEAAAAIGRSGNATAQAAFSLEKLGNELARYLTAVAARKQKNSSVTPL